MKRFSNIHEFAILLSLIISIVSLFHNEIKEYFNPKQVYLVVRATNLSGDTVSQRIIPATRDRQDRIQAVSDLKNGELNPQLLPNPNFSGNIKVFDSDGQIQFEANYRNGKANGKTTSYYNNIMLMSEIDMVDGTMHGELKSFITVTKSNIVTDDLLVANYRNGKAISYKSYNKGNLLRSCKYLNEVDTECEYFEPQHKD